MYLLVGTFPTPTTHSKGYVGMRNVGISTTDQGEPKWWPQGHPDRKIRMGFVDLATETYYSNEDISVSNEVIRACG